MKTLVLATFTALLFPTLALAGQVNGTLRQEGKLLPNAQVIIKCGKDNKKYSGLTNRRGAYSIFVSRRGKCTFTLPAYSGSSHVISSYKDPVRYNFELDRKGKLRKR